MGTRTVQDDDRSLIQYSQGWSSLVNDSRYSAQNYHSTSTIGDVATVTFTGTFIEIWGAKKRTYGTYNVTLDDRPVLGGSAFSEVDAFQQSLFTINGLTDGPHTMRITNNGQGLDIDSVVLPSQQNASSNADNTRNIAIGVVLGVVALIALGLAAWLFRRLRRTPPDDEKGSLAHESQHLAPQPYDYQPPPAYDGFVRSDPTSPPTVYIPPAREKELLRIPQEYLPQPKSASVRSNFSIVVREAALRDAFDPRRTTVPYETQPIIRTYSLADTARPGMGPRRVDLMEELPVPQPLKTTETAPDEGHTTTVEATEVDRSARYDSRYSTNAESLSTIRFGSPGYEDLTTRPSSIYSFDESTTLHSHNYEWRTLGEALTPTSLSAMRHTNAASDKIKRRSQRRSTLHGPRTPPPPIPVLPRTPKPLLDDEMIHATPLAPPPPRRRSSIPSQFGRPSSSSSASSSVRLVNVHAANRVQSMIGVLEGSTGEGGTWSGSEQSRQSMTSPLRRPVGARTRRPPPLVLGSLSAVTSADYEDRRRDVDPSLLDALPSAQYTQREIGVLLPAPRGRTMSRRGIAVEGGKALKVDSELAIGLPLSPVREG